MSSIYSNTLSIFDSFLKFILFIIVRSSSFNYSFDCLGTAKLWIDSELEDNTDYALGDTTSIDSFDLTDFISGVPLSKGSILFKSNGCFTTNSSCNLSGMKTVNGLLFYGELTVK